MPETKIRFHLDAHIDEDSVGFENMKSAKIVELKGVCKQLIDRNIKKV